MALSSCPKCGAVNPAGVMNCDQCMTEHPDVATVLENLAVLYRATRRDKEAEQLERRAASIRAIKR